MGCRACEPDHRAALASSTPYDLATPSIVRAIHPSTLRIYRLLVAQAARERLSLLTADRSLLDYGQTVRWVG